MGGQGRGPRPRPCQRPRTFVYGFLGLLGLTLATLAAGSRESFQANALRTSGMPYLIEGDRLRNLYDLHIQNKGNKTSSYSIAVADSGRSGLSVIIPQPVLHLDALEDGQTPLFLYLPRKAYHGAFPVTLSVADSLSGEVKHLQVMFRGP